MVIWRIWRKRRAGDLNLLGGNLANLAKSGVRSDLNLPDANLTNLAKSGVGGDLNLLGGNLTNLTKTACSGKAKRSWKVRPAAAGRGVLPCRCGERHPPE